MSLPSIRRHNNHSNRINDGTVGHVTRNDMDTMVDTSCAGENWMALEYTGDMCDVFPYQEDYRAIKDIPVATCATMVRGEDGTDILLIGHEMLYFGNKLNHSLLNQNQIRDHIRHFGGYVQDDFTREDEVFGIKTRDAFFPFYMEGSLISFDLRHPSNYKIENLPHVEITSMEKWDPKSKPLWLSTITQNRNYQDSTYETDHVLGSVDPILNEG